MIAVLFNCDNVRLGEHSITADAKLIYYGGLYFAPTTMLAELEDQFGFGIAWEPIPDRVANNRLLAGSDCWHLRSLDRERPTRVGRPMMVRIATADPRFR